MHEVVVNLLIFIHPFQVLFFRSLLECIYETVHNDWSGRFGEIMLTDSNSDKERFEKTHLKFE